MVQLNDLVNYTDTLLGVADYQDYCPNGLQVQGRAEVQKIVSGVTASQALIDAAIDIQADLLLGDLEPVPMAVLPCGVNYPPPVQRRHCHSRSLMRCSVSRY